MFNYEEFSVNENLAPSIEDYILVKSPIGNYYRHKDSDAEIDSLWIIESNGFISVNHGVSFYNRKITHIPFLFNKIKGFFTCSDCALLTSLKGCPQSVGDGFYCNNCDSLLSLEGSPMYVDSDFACWGCNSLISLKGISKSIGKNLVCSKCKSLKSIDYFQSIVKGNIIGDKVIQKKLDIIQNLYKQYPLLAKIEDYSLFVHTVIGYAPELKKYYKEIPELKNSEKDLSTFLYFFINKLFYCHYKFNE